MWKNKDVQVSKNGRAGGHNTRVKILVRLSGDGPSTLNLHSALTKMFLIRTSRLIVIRLCSSIAHCTT